MKIFKSLDEIKRDDCCILTTGTFDGVHRGHQAIIKNLQYSVSRDNECVTIVTFEPHPQFVIKSPQKNGLKLLTTIEEKILDLQQNKKDMFEHIIDGGQSVIKNLDTEQLKNLLEY